MGELGYPTIDADEVSRRVVDRNREEGKEGFEKVFKFFGASVLDNLGNLDRRALRKRMMANPHEHKKLEEILHPLIIAQIQKTTRLWKEQGVKLGFVEGARLIESGFHNLLGGIIVVRADEKNRVKRVMKRDHMGKDEVEMMVRLQDEAMMLHFAKVTWDNNGTEAALKKKIESFVQERAKSK